MSTAQNTMPAPWAPSPAVRGPVLRNGIKGVHEAFADYMLINPGCTLRDMGNVFGYSPAWICTVINSDMFKAYFATRREGISVSIAEDLPSRLAAAAHLATERIIEVVEKASDPEILIDAFDKVLHRYGYAPNAKGGAQASVSIAQQNNIFYLSRDELAGARAKLLEAHQEKEVKAEDAPAPALPAT